jgi:hypothetical protein
LSRASLADADSRDKWGGTNNLRVENNVTYNTVGHCFFLEDGVEQGNEFIRNLAIQTKCHTSKPCNPTNLAMFESTDGTNFTTAGQQSKDVLLPSDNPGASGGANLRQPVSSNPGT